MSSPSSTRIRWFAIAAVVVLLVIGIVPRWNRWDRASETAQAATTQLPVVNVVNARKGGSTAELELPGNTEALNVARIYARSTGYIRERRADIGTHVKGGQVLAVIESPETDAQLSQAKANLEQARAAVTQARANLDQAQAGVQQARAMVVQAQANRDIAQTTNTRWTRLVNRGVLPKQAGDERQSAYAAREAETEAAVASEKTAVATVSSREADIRAAEAAVSAQAANVQRLQRLQDFERVEAPFDGVVTERKVERGDLVTADAGGDRNLFSVAQGDTLRIQVNVPQTYSVDLKTGQAAEVTLRERPGKVYEGRVARTAEALDQSSRTLLSEVQLSNKNGELLPGMYAKVKFTLARSHPLTVIPGNAVVANASGTRVVTIGADDHVHFVPVELGRDMGSEVEVLKGLDGSERVATNPPDTLTEGQSVKTAAPPTQGKAKTN
ncbi:MAG: efflux RND transporter periplasmic adaptor subunit [Rhodospirillales bacterium]|nr:efflux RND transporter periplasmic adaptor subunit [Acetobacter sp.]